MAERKRWDKHSDFHPSALGGNGGAVDAAGPTAANDPVLEKQRQYIKMLEERNRLKKKLAVASKTQKEKDVLQEREEAFVTTFNVPKSAAAVHHHHHHHHHQSSSGVAVRKNKSAATLLPTQMAQPTAVASGKSFSEQSANDRHSQCKSAPSTTLHFHRGDIDSGDAFAAKASGERFQQPVRATRAKWSRPQGPMNIAVENRDGRAHLCLTDQIPDERANQDEKGIRDDDDDGGTEADTSGDRGVDGEEDDEDDNGSAMDESYLEESFEEFDEDDKSDDEDTGCRPHDQSHRTAKAKYDDIPEQQAKEQIADSKGTESASDSAPASSPATVPTFSHTTTQLLDIIQHLSRSKQKALTDVLQRFQASEQGDNDVKVLQSSIGDPEIWKQLTATLFSVPEHNGPSSLRHLENSTVARNKSHDHRSRDYEPAVNPLAQVLQEQQKWEEQYAREVKERLVKEREEKEKALRDAEARRIAMMKQLEEEERELERLMERKRQERLAKLRALEQEIDTVTAPIIIADGTTPVLKKSAESKVTVDDLQDACREQEPSRAEKTPEMEEKKRDLSISPTTRKSQKIKTKKGKQLTSSRDEDLLSMADAKSATLGNMPHEAKHFGASLPRSKSRAKDSCSVKDAISMPIIPPLKLGSAAFGPAVEHNDGLLQPSTSVEVRIKILSTWGKTRAVGLTQICAYDVNGNELPIEVASLKLYDRADGQPLSKSHDMVRGLGRLVNGIAHTNNEQDMWLGRVSDSDTLQIGFEVSSAPSKLCVWNHNSKLCTACARDIEVLVSGKCVWTGSLPETFGDEDDNMCTWLDVLSNSKKTARTSRPNEMAATSRSRADPDSMKLSASIHESQTVRVEKSIPGTPLWLSEPSAPHTSRSVSSSSEAKLDLFASEDKAVTSGSSTARRRYHNGAELFSDNDMKLMTKNMDYQRATTTLWADAMEKEQANRVDEPRHSNSGESKQISSASKKMRLSSSSVWDTLEHFSKTNRSRLSQPVNDLDAEFASSTSKKAEAKENYPEQKLASSKTSSALLSELKSMTSTLYGPGNNSSSASYAKSSSFSTAAASPQVSSFDDVQSVPEIPVLPSGKRLKMEILSTWGDPHYVGLNGIELFDDHGKSIRFQDPERQVRGRPASINELDEYTDDPRVPKNLVDGVNCTCDDFHMWLAPFTIGEEHFVELEMNVKVSLSMIRVWNYNKSRAHSFRGVRHARLILYESAAPASSSPLSHPNSSGTVIFEGEISKALGLVSADSIDQSCEVILFTRDESILKAIEVNDQTLLKYTQNNEEEEETSSIVANVRSSMEMQRPRTSDKGNSANLAANPSPQHINQGNNHDPPRLGKDGRPMTAAIRPANRGVQKSIDSWVSDGEPQQKSPVLDKVVENDHEEDDDRDDENLIRGRRITVKLLTTWGDLNYIGLTQLDVLVGKNGIPYPLDLSQVDATPRDLESLGYHGDPRTLDKLIDGVGTTYDDTHMWLVPLSTAQEIRIDLKKEQYIYGLRVWNYNKSPDDTFRGVKQIHVLVDGVLISPKVSGFLVRKAPGIALFDFDQAIKFDAPLSSKNVYLERIQYPFQSRTYKTPIIKQDYEPSLFPQGFLLKFVFWTTWGDPYYLGLNGMEIYDYNGKKLQLAPQVITAKPYSIAEITKAGGSGSEDVRVPENLVNGRNKNTWDASDAWLAPLASSLGKYEGNVVYMAFDFPIVISMIKFWNYSKTPERGVKEMDIYLDDLHLYSGTLRKAPSGGDVHHLGRLGTKVQVTEEFSQPIMFTTNQAQVDQEKRKVYYCGMEEQDVLCINEGQVMQESKAMYRKPDPGVEGVVVDLGLRPTTALCRHKSRD